MSEWVSPSFEHLKSVIEASKGTLILCSPYVSKTGLDAVCDSLPSSVEAVEVWTKLSRIDWFTGASDPPALAKFLQRVKERGRSIQIRCSNDLHAKVIISDGSMSLAGSANLTNGGFKQNKEIARIVTGEEIEQLRDVAREISGKLSFVSDHDFQTFVSWCECNRDQRKKFLAQLPASPHQSTLDEGWVTLSEFKFEPGKPPSEIHLPDGTQKQLRSGASLWWKPQIGLFAPETLRLTIAQYGLAIIGTFPWLILNI